MAQAQTEVVYDGLHVVQPGLEPVHYPTKGNFVQITGAYTSAPKESRICGLRTVTFWLVTAITALAVIVVGVAVGLGVGLKRAQSSGSHSASAMSATSTLSQPSSTTAPTASRTTVATSIPSTSTTSSAASSTATVSSTCPDGNNTVTEESLGSISYRILCDSDFGGSGKETLASTVLSSFDDCLSLCNTMNYFQDRIDVGCTYNFAGTGTQTAGTCWCLGGTNKTVVENVGNEVAVPL